MKDQDLIFLISQPRSGSTLLQTILSNSPDIYTNNDENWILLPFLSYDRPDLTNSIFGSELASAAISKNYSKEFITSELKTFLGKLYSHQPKGNSKYIMDKTPRYYEILDEIIECFPKAKIIVLKRNPLDVFASIYEKWPRKNFFDFNYFSRDIFNAPIIIDKFLRENSDNPNVYSIKYENMVLDPKGEFQQLFNWLNISFENGFLSYQKNMSPEFGDDKITMHKHIHDDSIDKWKTLLKWNKYHSFIKGYINYLIKNDFKDYDIDSYNNNPTFTFHTLLKFSDFMSDKEQEFSFNNLLNYLKYYILSKVL